MNEKTKLSQKNNSVPRIPLTIEIQINLFLNCKAPKFNVMSLSAKNRILDRIIMYGIKNALVTSVITSYHNRPLYTTICLYKEVLM